MTTIMCFILTYCSTSLYFLLADFCQFKKREFSQDFTKQDVLCQYKAFAPTVLCNLLILTPLSLTLLAHGVQTTSFSHLQCFIQLVVFTAIFECCFYVVHRILHIPFFFNRIHYVHHQAKVCIGFGAIYCHPIEFLFGNVLPVVLGPLIYQECDNVTLCVWAALAAFTTVCAHSGYIILDKKMTHLLHHRYVTNRFGIFGLFD